MRDMAIAKRCCIESEISTYQVHIDGNQEGYHPLECSLMLGFFDGRLAAFICVGCGSLFCQSKLG